VNERVRLDRDGYGGVTVVVDGTPQSYVQPEDPLLLVFEYVQHFALVVGSLRPGPLAVTHVGGAGLTFPRWVEAVRPGSTQVVLEPDVEVTAVVRRELPLPRRHRIRVRPVDGVVGMRELADRSADVVVVDAYAGGRMPASVTTVPFLTDVRRVLRPSGVLLVNVADEPRRRFLGRVLATVAAAGYAHRLVVATSEVMRGRRFGNSVVAASASPLDVAAVRRGVSTMAFPAGVRHGGEVERMVAGARPFTEGDAEASPEPPDLGSWHLR
jgi:spermidine synthase